MTPLEEFSLTFSLEPSFRRQRFPNSGLLSTRTVISLTVQRSNWSGILWKRPSTPRLSRSKGWCARCFDPQVVELYQTLQTRHGVMVVGLTGSGKTTSWQLLERALTRLAKEVRFEDISVSAPPFPSPWYPNQLFFLVVYVFRKLAAISLFAQTLSTPSRWPWENSSESTTTRPANGPTESSHPSWGTSRRWKGGHMATLVLLRSKEGNEWWLLPQIILQHCY